MLFFVDWFFRIFAFAPKNCGNKAPFIFVSVHGTKNRNKLTWLNICIYSICIKPLQISRVSFSVFFFCDLFFFQLVTNRAVLFNSQNSETSNGAEKLRFNGFASPFANFNQVEKCEWRTDFFGSKSWGWRVGMTYFLEVWMILCEISKANRHEVGLISNSFWRSVG